MFREITVSRQSVDGPKRRWYQSDYFDLYVFYIRHSERADKHADREFVGMQLCYDIRRNQRTLEWKKADGFAHHAVKKGGDTLSDHGASAALLQKGGTFDAEKVIDRFMADSAALPAQVKTFVLKKLAEYAKANPPSAEELAARAAAAQAAEAIAAQVEAEAAAYANEQMQNTAVAPSATTVAAAPPPVAVQVATPTPKQAPPSTPVMPVVKGIEDFTLDDLLNKA